MQPDFPPSEDPEVVEDEFAIDELPDVSAVVGTPVHGVLVVEGEPTRESPQREFAPGSLSWVDLPFSLKWQPAEGPDHDGAVVVARVDQVWRDGNLIRFTGQMDSAGENGAEAERLLAGGFLSGVSIMNDDTMDEDVELIFPDGAPAGGEVEMDLAMGAKPSKVVMHKGRIRSATILPEGAFSDAFVALGESPFQPPLPTPGEPESVAAGDAEVVLEPTGTEEFAAEVAPAVPAGPVKSARRLELERIVAEEDAAARPRAVVAASYTITIPEVWPESWFDEPEELPPFGALHVTAEGRVYGLLGPNQVQHRAFRSGPRKVTVPTGVDYSEFNNKPCLVAGGDGQVYRINAGTITFDCGHADPYDPRRADPNWATQHYDNSCSVAARVRIGESRKFGGAPWVAGGLVHGMTASAVQQMMGCALSGDWQDNRLKAALLVPVEGFPAAVRASVRVREGSLVASALPVRYVEPPPDPLAAAFDAAFAIVASATGRGPDVAFAELAAQRFEEISTGR